MAYAVKHGTWYPTPLRVWEAYRHRDVNDAIRKELECCINPIDNEMKGYINRLGPGTDPSMWEPKIITMGLTIQSGTYPPFKHCKKIHK